VLATSQDATHDSARHVKGRHLNHGTRIQNAFDHVASTAYQGHTAGNLSDTTFAQTYIPGGRQSGIKLNKDWADEIRNTLYTPYILTNTDVIAIIEVEVGGQ
jgi:hypothetical protein